MAIDLSQFDSKKPKVDLSKFSKPKPSFGEKFKGNTVKGFQELISPTVGALKGAGSTLAGISELGQKGLRAITNPITSRLGVEQKPIERPEALKEALTPQNTGERIGFGTEQLAEFLAPTGAVLKAEKAIKGAKVISKLPKMIQGTAKLAGVSGIEAGTFAGITAAQEGDINKEVGTSALIGGAIPIAGSTYQKVIKPILKFKIPSKLINSLIKPASKEFKFGKNPGLAVAKEGITANSIEGLEKKVISKRKLIGQEIGRVAKGAKGEFNITDDIEKTLQKHLLNKTDEATVKQMNNVLDQLANIKKVSIQDGKMILENIGKRNISKMTAEELHNFQKLIGKLTKWTGSSAEKEVNKMLSELYGKVSKKLSSVQGLKELQKRYSNILGAQKALENRVARATSNNMLGLQALGSGTVGALTGETTTDKIQNAILFGLFGKALGSTAFKTRAASFLAKESTGKLAQRFFGASAKKAEEQLPKLNQLLLGK